MLTHTVKATCAPAILHIQCESTDSGGGVVLDRAAPPPQTPQPRHIPLHPQFDCVARETSGRYAGLVFLHNDVQIKHRSVIKKRSRGGKLAFYSHSRHFIQQVLKAKSSYFSLFLIFSFNVLFPVSRIWRACVIRGKQTEKRSFTKSFAVFLKNNVSYNETSSKTATC